LALVDDLYCAAPKRDDALGFQVVNYGDRREIRAKVRKNSSGAH